MGFFPKGLQNEFETAVVNEPSVCEPLKVYCISLDSNIMLMHRYDKERVKKIQSNFNGSNTFGTMKICSRQGQFELLSVNHSTRTESKVEIFF